jgi:hypothetical protein
MHRTPAAVGEQKVAGKSHLSRATALLSPRPITVAPPVRGIFHTVIVSRVLNREAMDAPFLILIHMRQLVSPYRWIVCFCRPTKNYNINQGNCGGETTLFYDMC